MSDSTIFYVTIMLMSAHCSLRLHPPLITVFGKIGDTYPAYCNTDKAHAMATLHRSSGNPLDGDIDVTRETQNTPNTGTEDFNTAETVHFEDLEHNNLIKLTALTRKIDDLHQQVQAGEGQPMETLNCIEHELQKLSITPHPPSPIETLGEVIRHYTNTLCSAEKQTNLTTSLLQDIPYSLDMIPHT